MIRFLFWKDHSGRSMRNGKNWKSVEERKSFKSLPQKTEEKCDDQK